MMNTYCIHAMKPSTSMYALKEYEYSYAYTYNEHAYCVHTMNTRIAYIQWTRVLRTYNEHAYCVHTMNTRIAYIQWTRVLRTYNEHALYTFNEYEYSYVCLSLLHTPWIPVLVFCTYNEYQYSYSYCIHIMNTHCIHTIDTTAPMYVSVFHTYTQYQY